jgi:hypothetical protein
MSPCFPLERRDRPITLSNVLAVGKHPDGMIYVIDEVLTGDRAFASEGSLLIRRVVAGVAGDGDRNAGTWIVEVLEPPAFKLKVEMSSGVPVRMGVIRGVTSERDFTIGAQGDVLEVIGQEAIRDLILVNLPGFVDVPFDAVTEDGHRLVVTHPSYEWTYSDFRVFYGTPERMIERELVRASAGNSTWVTFKVDGLEETAFFPGPVGGPIVSPATQLPWLTANGVSSPLVMVNPDAGLGDLTFLCR